MSKPELVLSNTVTFFSGSLEKFFKKAQKVGFKYTEIIPYKWTRPEEIFLLEEKYGVEVAGIHMPEWWKKSLLEAVKDRPNSIDKIFAFIWEFYLGAGINNPGIEIAKALSAKGRNPYLLLHSNLVGEMGNNYFKELASRFHIVIENIPGDNPAEIQKIAPIAFDPGHYKKTFVELPAPPEIIHISYDHFPIIHGLPNKAEQHDLKKMLAINPPQYIVLETNPWVSVAKGKRLLDQIINESRF